jgi:hypothetical protein
MANQAAIVSECIATHIALMISVEDW